VPSKAFADPGMGSELDEKLTPLGLEEKPNYTLVPKTPQNVDEEAGRKKAHVFPNVKKTLLKQRRLRKATLCVVPLVDRFLPVSQGVE